MYRSEKVQEVQSVVQSSESHYKLKGGPVHQHRKVAYDLVNPVGIDK